MWDLKTRYPANFWANPDEFFLDGPLVNCGSDFGLMPSLFEPGGIVQHEFFVAGTPVLAFRTGGLKDTVHEYDATKNKGNGFTFESHDVEDFKNAFRRAYRLYQDRQRYLALRANASESVIDVADVARAWNKEFYRLWDKFYIDLSEIKEHEKEITADFDPDKVNRLEKILWPSRIERPDTDKTNRLVKKLLLRRKAGLGIFKKVQFVYKTNQLPRPKKVQVYGSFDSWHQKHDMIYHTLQHTWTLTLQLRPGEYLYGYYVDGHWKVSDNDPRLTDNSGNINNYVRVTF
eukprot:TRINITY_DN4856_c0_g1_i4.p1 TRINITY_DN4856_c0_g1~~TRINITY_DN4856_c0_g1_i4.p1  ORF type:complete len:289 (+),score=87.40 TRINITY_DN4856_c0_g1_i4:373-1239(+)